METHWLSVRTRCSAAVCYENFWVWVLLTGRSQLDKLQLKNLSFLWFSFLGTADFNPCIFAFCDLLSSDSELSRFTVCKSFGFSLFILISPNVLCSWLPCTAISEDISRKSSRFLNISLALSLELIQVWCQLPTFNVDWKTFNISPNRSGIHSNHFNLLMCF